MTDEQKEDLKKKIKKSIASSKKYNFTKLWFIKYNNFILLSIFIFFFLKIKKIKKYKKKKPSNIVAKIFFNKNRGKNVKRTLFLSRDYMIF